MRVDRGFWLRGDGKWASALVLAIGMGLSGCRTAMPSSAQHALLGTQLPSFEAETLDDRMVSVPGYLRTKITVIDFWASWCGACRETMPALDALWREQHDAGLQVIGVSLDEHVYDAAQGAMALGASFPIVHDQGQQFASMFRVNQVPTTFVLDRRGTVRWVGVDPASVRRAVTALLDE